MSSDVESPCLNICVIDEHNICQGCFRNLKEIELWSVYSEIEKRQVLKNAEQRKQDE